MPEAPRRSRDIPTAAPRRNPRRRSRSGFTNYRSIKLLTILNAMARHQSPWSVLAP